MQIIAAYNRWGRSDEVEKIVIGFVEVFLVLFSTRSFFILFTLLFFFSVRFRSSVKLNKKQINTGILFFSCRICTHYVSCNTESCPVTSFAVLLVFCFCICVFFIYMLNPSSLCLLFRCTKFCFILL